MFQLTGGNASIQYRSACVITADHVTDMGES
jgi:hypothetical protein